MEIVHKLTWATSRCSWCLRANTSFAHVYIVQHPWEQPRFSMSCRWVRLDFPVHMCRLLSQQLSSNNSFIKQNCLVLLIFLFNVLFFVSALVIAYSLMFRIKWRWPAIYFSWFAWTEQAIFKPASAFQKMIEPIVVNGKQTHKKRRTVKKIIKRKHGISYILARSLLFDSNWKVSTNIALNLKTLLLLINKCFYVVIHSTPFPTLDFLLQQQ